LDVEEANDVAAGAPCTTSEPRLVPSLSFTASNSTVGEPYSAPKPSTSVAELALNVSRKRCQVRVGAVLQYRCPQPRPDGLPTNPRVTTGCSGLIANVTVYD
jgi:hypothetical protein